MDGIYPACRPQQPVQPFWMGNSEVYENELWQVVQGDTLAFFIEVFCDCPMTVDVTGYSFYFLVKASMDPTDPTNLLVTAWTEYHGACGWTALIILGELTAQVPSGRYAFDCKSRSPGGVVQTMKRGEIDFLPSTNIDLSTGVVIPPPGPVSLANQQAAIARSFR
jgi:hypothetical protein